MTVYVDEAEWKKPNGRVAYCHMTADTLEELHEFAERVGIKRCWYHRKTKYPHYDVSTRKRADAIEAGAVEIPSKQLVMIARMLHESS